MKHFCKAHYSIFIWLLFYLFFLAIWFEINKKTFIVVTIIHIISIVVALTPIGEAMVRLLLGARKIRVNKETVHLEYLFNEVHREAIKKYNISPNIKLYIQDTLMINGYAIGNNTIVITRGAMQTCTNDQLKGIFAHEFSHIVNWDTKIMMIFTIGNGLFSVILLLLRIILNIIRFIITDGGTNFNLITLFFSIVRLCVEIPIYVITLFGNFLIMLNSRQSEYGSDDMACKLGYRSELLEFLYFLYNINIENRFTIRDMMFGTHPHLTKRIERLEKKE